MATTPTPTDRLHRILTSRIESTEAPINAFKAKLESDPFYAFEWSDDAMKAAATRRVLGLCQVDLTNGMSPEKVAAACTQRAMRAAQFPRFSTSAPSNAMALYEGAAWAEAAEFFTDHLS